MTKVPPPQHPSEAAIANVAQLTRNVLPAQESHLTAVHQLSKHLENFMNPVIKQSKGPLGWILGPKVTAPSLAELATQDLRAAGQAKAVQAVRTLQDVQEALLTVEATSTQLRSAQQQAFDGVVALEKKWLPNGSQGTQHMRATIGSFSPIDLHWRLNAQGTWTGPGDPPDITQFANDWLASARKNLESKSPTAHVDETKYRLPSKLVPYHDSDGDADRLVKEWDKPFQLASFNTKRYPEEQAKNIANMDGWIAASSDMIRKDISATDVARENELTKVSTGKQVLKDIDVGAGDISREGTPVV